MIQNIWLDYIEDLCEVPYMAYFNVLRNMKGKDFMIKRKDD